MISKKVFNAILTDAMKKNSIISYKGYSWKVTGFEQSSASDEDMGFILSEIDGDYECFVVFSDLMYEAKMFNKTLTIDFHDYGLYIGIF